MVNVAEHYDDRLPNGQDSHSRSRRFSLIDIRSSPLNFARAFGICYVTEWLVLKRRGKGNQS